MLSTIGAVVLFVAIIVMIFWGGASMVRGITRDRYTAQGDNVEELMFRAEHNRRLNQRAGIQVPPRWWQRLLHRSRRG